MAQIQATGTGGKADIVTPYSAHDIVRVMNFELSDEIERDLGAHLGGDLRSEDDQTQGPTRRNERDGLISSLSFLRSLVLLRSA
jgi:hypothetical protein